MRAGAFNLTQDWEELQDEFQQLYPVAVLQAALNGSLHDPGFNLSSLLPSGVSFQDPMFFNDQGSNVSSQTQARTYTNHASMTTSSDVSAQHGRRSRVYSFALPGTRNSAPRTPSRSQKLPQYVRLHA